MLSRAPSRARELLQGYVTSIHLWGFQSHHHWAGPQSSPTQTGAEPEHSGTESQAGFRGPHTPAPHLAPQGHPAPFAASGALPPTSS